MFSTGDHADIRPLIETISTAIAVFGPSRTHDFELVSANSMFGGAFGFDIESHIGSSVADWPVKTVITELRAALRACFEHGTSQDLELAVHRAGATAWWRLLLSPVSVSPGESLARVLVMASDVTERRRLEQVIELSHRRFAAIVNSAYDGIISVGPDQRIEMMNEAAKAMFGITDASERVHLESLLPDRFRARHEEYLNEFKHSSTLSRPMQLRGSVIGLRVDGSEFPLEVTIAKIRVGANTEVVAVMRDISERTHMIEDLKIAATVDVLTNVPNRRALMDAAQAEFSRSGRFGHAMSVLLFDIDHFKTVNDRFGHAAGDLILKSVVKRAQTVLRDVDILGRWGGEEFIVILLELNEDGAMRCAERLRRAMESEMFALADGKAVVPITVSVGVSTRSETVKTVDELFARADAAMYRAKNAGRNQIST